MSSLPSVLGVTCPAPLLAAGRQGVQRVAVRDATAQLLVTFWNPVGAAESPLYKAANYSLFGGETIFPKVLRAEPGTAANPPALHGASVLLTLDRLGDFSVYTLTVSGAEIDPFFGSAKLRFRLGCEEPFDCRTPAAAATATPETPVNIDYLSKDYAGFRQALLDFIPTRLPAWTERSEADLGMVLVELFSATADNLSYLQDRMANEAFLATASERRSVASHLALIGYAMDNGSAAYTWLQFQVNAPARLSATAGFKVTNQPATQSGTALVFETIADAALSPALNALRLYDWGNSGCCLEEGALTCALLGSFEQLQAGDSLLLDDGAGQRDVVRLTAAPGFLTVPASPPVDLTVVAWSRATPLSGCYPVAQTVVRGNLVLATHGETIEESLTTAAAAAGLNGIAVSSRVTRQRVALSNGPLTYLDPAVTRLAGPPGQGTAVTSIADRPKGSASTLRVQVGEDVWTEQRTLLNSGAADKVFRVELDDEGEATLVFGDGVFGGPVPAGAALSLSYRVGCGAVGNVGPDTLTLAQPASPAAWLTAVTNPLAASNGRELESSDHARRNGPAGIHQALVAVTPQDYQQAALDYVDENGRPLLQRANASLRWSGSWLTVTLSIDPLGAETVAPALRQGLLQFLNQRRLTGYDLEILAPVYVPVDLQLGYVAGAGSNATVVEQGILQALGSGTRAGGALGLFHPDNLTFGQNLYVSSVYAAVMAVAGVQSAQITRLARMHAQNPAAETAANLAQGMLTVGQDQILRLDNDRNLPQNGALKVSVMAPAKGGSA